MFRDSPNILFCRFYVQKAVQKQSQNAQEIITSCSSCSQHDLGTVTTTAVASTNKGMPQGGHLSEWSRAPIIAQRPKSIIWKLGSLHSYLDQRQ